MIQHIRTLDITKIAVTLFVSILIPIYWRAYGPENFLWLSDIGLLLTLCALWLQSRLLISITAIAILPVEIGWAIDFFVQLFTGHNILGIAHYMFEPHAITCVKSLSLFHLAMPILWIRYIFKWGYDRRALPYGVILVWMIAVFTYLFTNPARNINWVFMPALYHWQWMPSLVWLAILMAVYPLLIMWPVHILMMHRAKTYN
jgi:hypothetical protein